MVIVILSGVLSTYDLMKTVPALCMAAAPFVVCANGLSFSVKSFNSEKSDLSAVKWTDAPESTTHGIRPF